MDEEKNNHPRSYSEDDNYFDRNEGLMPSNDPITGIRQKEDTEFSSETATFNPSELDRDKMKQEERESRMEEHVDAGWGWIALVLSLLAFFVWTFLFAVVGAIMGIYAKRRGANTLGNIAIGLALVAIVIRLFVYPIL
ncbi:hypothetical protein [Halalkalibacillus halophilus]|uniref:hypothetical protein n=1 Tax=Halalkalibacillus halophilus TaxID=392827 RepID=UPI0003FA7466|nr:hypothetical protein [Halalkalibacillus halophilus]